MPVVPTAPLSPLRKGGKPLQLHRAEPYSTCGVQRAGCSGVAGTFKAGSGCLPAGRGSARAAEDKEWNKWAEKWRVELAPALEGSPSFAGLDKELASASLNRVVQRSAASTLRKHFPGWRLWKRFASAHGWEGVASHSRSWCFSCKPLAEAGHAPAAASSLRLWLAF